MTKKEFLEKIKDLPDCEKCGKFHCVCEGYTILNTDPPNPSSITTEQLEETYQQTQKGTAVATINNKKN